MLKDRAAREIQRLDEAICWATDRLKGAPEGSLLVDKTDRRTYYYWRTSTCERKGAYLGKEKSDLIRALAQKDYEKRLIKTAREERSRISKLLAYYELRDAKQSEPGCARSHDADILAAVYEELPEQRKHLVIPYALPIKEYVKEWQSQEYVGNTHPYGSISFFTRRGEQVRSKSEVIIADALDAAQVPYHYEKPIQINPYSQVYPDFTVLNTRTRTELIWEHFGLMDDQAYRDKALRRINEYALAGIHLGKTLIVTFETANVPLDTRTVNACIEQYLG